MSITDFIELMAVIIGVVGIYAGFRSVNNQMFIQIFSDYTRRYADIMDGVPQKARKSEKFEELSPDEQERFIKAMRNYMNLCSEEFFLAETKRLDPKTWEMWKLGIKATLNDYPSFAEVWEQLKPEYNCYPEFREMMSNLFNGSGDSISKG